MYDKDTRRATATATPTVKPKKVSLKDFVQVIYLIIEVLQTLNHQSISRWRKTKEFANLQEKIDLKHLATQLTTPTADNNNNNNHQHNNDNNNNSLVT